MPQFWVEFTTIALAHGLAVASPGPDFAVVTQHSLRQGHRVAYLTSAGIAIGILVHVMYSLLGVGWLMQSTPLLFESIKLLGACYLLYLGWTGLRSTPRTAIVQADNESHGVPSLPGLRAFRQGFLTNVLNPKATLFFVSLFAVAVSPETPLWALAVYGLWMSLATLLWFMAVATLFGHPGVRRKLLSQSHWIDRCMGSVLIAIGLHILLVDQTLLPIAW
ncbi:MAG: LysE family transporter [Hahellaceae bacterium]|nr:LysE family transporter [Hahellaceae bacterium]